jgi:hypothetical protein
LVVAATHLLPRRLVFFCRGEGAVVFKDAFGEQIKRVNMQMQDTILLTRGTKIEAE